MNKVQIIEQIGRDPDYQTICRQIAKDLGDDLFQELAIILMEYDEARLQRIWPRMKGYFYRMAHIQFHGTKSEFFKKYRGHDKHVRDNHADILQAWESYEEPDPEFVSRVQQAVDDGYWYDQGVLKLYIEYGTLKRVKEQTGIPIMSIHGTISSFKNIIKKKILKYE